MRSGFTAQKVPGSIVDFSGNRPVVKSVEVLPTDEAEDALRREVALAVEDEPVIDEQWVSAITPKPEPSFPEDTKVLSKWLRGAPVETLALVRELRLWGDYFGSKV